MHAALRRAREAAAMILGLGLLALICLGWTPFALVLGPLMPEASGKRLGRQAIHNCFRFYV